MPADGVVGGSPLAAAWALEPGMDFLNHGSFGACPRDVLAAQARLRARLEAQPVRFMVRELPALAARAREALGAFVGADPDDLALIPNATAGAPNDAKDDHRRPTLEVVASFPLL